MEALAAGVLLIADPFLQDPNFKRSVIFLCDHQDEGSFGFVINRSYEHTMDELIDGFEGHPLPVFFGGPVQPDTIHFLHQYPALIPGGVEILEGVYWGGNFEMVKKLAGENRLEADKIRFFIGYSGWGKGQLHQEMEEKTWLTVTATRNLIFGTSPDDVWGNSLRHLGGEYTLLVNYPNDPRLN